MLSNESEHCKQTSDKSCVNMSRPPFPDSPMCAILAILDQMAAQVGPTFPGNSER